MINILREAQKHFQQLQHLLNTPIEHDKDYFTKLSIESEEAYVLMNEGMCASLSVCHECADHRDFIRTILETLSELESNGSLATAHTAKLTEYSDRVNKILQNIAVVLAS